MRSPWKKLYVDHIFRNLILRPKRPNAVKKAKAILFIENRACGIVKSMVGRKVGVYNGREYIGYTVKDYMIGHKYGEYVHTRKVGNDMHFRKKGRKPAQHGAPIKVKKKK